VFLGRSWWCPIDEPPFRTSCTMSSLEISKSTVAYRISVKDTYSVKLRRGATLWIIAGIHRGSWSGLSPGSDGNGKEVRREWLAEEGLYTSGCLVSAGLLAVLEVKSGSQ
jgi:hypothetical protein